MCIMRSLLSSSLCLGLAATLAGAGRAHAQGAPDVVWEDVMMIMRQQINQLIKHLGELVINKQAGVLLASDDGKFIGDFVSKMKSHE